MDMTAAPTVLLDDSEPGPDSPAIPSRSARIEPVSRQACGAGLLTQHTLVPRMWYLRSPRRGDSGRRTLLILSGLTASHGR